MYKEGDLKVKLLYLDSNINLIEKLEQDARQEWLKSAIEKDIFDLNVKVLVDDEPYDYLLYSEATPRRNDGRIRDGLYRKYRHIEKGGWFCSGVDPLNNYQSMLWGCFKPRSPRRDHEKQHKLIKYEHPYRTSTRAFFLAVSERIWQMCAEKYQIPIEPEDKLLGFWAWVRKHNIPLIITEGCKKAAALLSLGYAAIGLPGVNAGYRTPKNSSGVSTGNPQLIEDLLFFTNPGRRVTLCFDKDDKLQTIQRVRKAIGQTARLLTLNKCNVAIAQWDEDSKGIDDLIVDYGVELAIKSIESAFEYELWNAREYAQLTYTPALKLNQKYLGEIIIPEIEKLIVLKAPKGSGKTQSLAPIVAEANRNGQPVILISHRVQLAQAIAERVGIPYVSQLKSCEFGSLLGYALCVDSLHPYGQAQFNAENWREPLVIIDECEQVFWHTLTASTEVKKHRLEVFKQISQLFKNALAPGRGKVILADADVSDLSIELVLGLGVAENIYPWIVANLWRGSSYNLFHYEESTPIAWLGALEEHIKQGGKPFIAVDGQKASSAWGTKVLEGYLRKLFPDLRVLRIDSESIADPEHEAYGCIEQLNQILLNYDIVLASPSIGTGVSIDLINHFSSVWGAFQGVAEENASRQALSRIRQNIDRHLWVSKLGLGFVGNGALSLKSLLACEEQKFRANLNLLQHAGITFDEEIDINKTALNVWGKMGVRINAGMAKYRETMIRALRDEGHTILSPEMADSYEIQKEAIKEQKEITYTQECEEIQQEDITEMTAKDYETLKQQKAKTKSERHKQRKYNLVERYGIEPTVELIKEDNKGYYSKLRLAYYLGVGRAFLSDRDVKAAEKLIEVKSAWLPDFNKSQLGLRIGALEAFEIPKIVDILELRGTDPILQKLATNALSVKWQVRAVLGITLNDKDSPITILRQILTKLGLRLQYLYRDGTGERARVYKVVGSDDGRDAIFQKWLDAERPLKASNRLDPPLGILEEAIQEPQELPPKDNQAQVEGKQ